MSILPHAIQKMDVIYPFYVAVPSSGLYFTLNDAVYLPGDTINMVEIGVYISHWTPSLPLVCVTSNVNTECCRARETPSGEPVGNWHFPDGSLVPRRALAPNNDFSRSGFTQQVRLHRMNNATTPMGLYECRVPDNSGMLHTASILLIGTITQKKKIRVWYRCGSQEMKPS